MQGDPVTTYHLPQHCSLVLLARLSTYSVGSVWLEWTLFLLGWAATCCPWQPLFLKSLRSPSRALCLLNRGSWWKGGESPQLGPKPWFRKPYPLGHQQTHRVKFLTPCYSGKEKAKENMEGGTMGKK